MHVKAIICAIASAKRTIQREIRELKQEIRHMALDLAKLTAAVDRSTKATEALIAAHAARPGLSAVQAAIDTQADAPDVESAKAEAAVAPAA